MNKMQKKALYESIMANVAKQVKKALNENENDEYTTIEELTAYINKVDPDHNRLCNLDLDNGEDYDVILYIYKHLSLEDSWKFIESCSYDVLAVALALYDYDTCTTEDHDILNDIYENEWSLDADDGEFRINNAEYYVRDKFEHVWVFTGCMYGTCTGQYVHDDNGAPRPYRQSWVEYEVTGFDSGEATLDCVMISYDDPNFGKFKKTK